MRATLILEASKPDGAMYRVQTSLDLYGLSWLLRFIGL